MDYTGTDIYCDIILKGEITLRKEYESENVLAFHHTNPFWTTHVVIVPKKHIDSLTSFTKEEEPILTEMMEVIRELADKVVKETGAARVVTNLGDYQTSKHLHFYIHSGEDLRPHN
jgi:histidine triad (HIT) family protein